MTVLAATVPNAGLAVGLVMLGTGLFGWLWATGGNASVPITAGNPDAAGRISSVVALTPTTYSVPNGNALKVQGVDLYDITNIHSPAINNLTARFYVLNPQDMAGVLANPNSFLLVKVTEYDDPEVVYGSAMVTRERASVLLQPTGIPGSTSRLKLRAEVVVPGGSPPGVQLDTVSGLTTLLEVSQR